MIPMLCFKAIGTGTNTSYFRSVARISMLYGARCNKEVACCDSCTKSYLYFSFPQKQITARMCRICGRNGMEPGRIELPCRNSQQYTSTQIVRCSISVLRHYIWQTDAYHSKLSFSFLCGLQALWNQPEFCTPRCIRRRERCVAGYAASA